jgi:nucleoside-diphosphate-sugar epimerase
VSVRVFVLGAGGYLGGAIAARLARAGHEVEGLVRSEEAAAVLTAHGIRPTRGDLLQPSGYATALRDADAVVQAAAGPGAEAEAVDRAALEAIRQGVTDGRVRRVLYTSGVWVYGDTHGRLADESTPRTAPLPLVRWRVAHEEAALALAERGAGVTVFQPSLVYGGTRGVLASLFASARKRGEVTWPGTGEQSWGLVHVEDLAEAYRLAAERPDPAPGGPAGGRFILNDGSEQTAREIAEAVARVTGVPARSWPRDEVLARLGLYGEALLSGQRVTAAKARRELAWTPRHASFTTEVDGQYRQWLATQGSATA